MNKSDLINAMAAEAQMSKADAKKHLMLLSLQLLMLWKLAIKYLSLVFGTFSVSERAERTGINPSTKANYYYSCKESS